MQARPPCPQGAWFLAHTLRRRERDGFTAFPNINLAYVQPTLPERFYMGTQAISDAALNAAAPRPATSVVSSNVIYLADLPAGASIPAYRRARLRLAPPVRSNPSPIAALSSAAVTAPAPASWVFAAQRRAAQRIGSALKPSATANVPAQSRRAGDAPVRSIGAVGAVSVPNPVRPGGLRLTGRLVDVCAELERLAQAEAVADAMALRA